MKQTELNARSRPKKSATAKTMSIRTLLIVFSIFLFYGFSSFAAEPDYKAPHFSYNIINTYPHDPTAFTQGLIWYKSSMYEGTGLLGRSSLRRVDLETGKIEQQVDCDDNIFGEGITISGDYVYQLTWKNHLAFVYNKKNFTLVKSFDYPRQGWGLTHDTLNLIASDGTATLYFLDPETFYEKRKITVHEGNNAIQYLNELEYIGGKIFANIYKSDHIVIINPTDGLVQGWIDLAGLHDQLHLNSNEAVLNGIMYDQEDDKLFVTGKLWPKLFQIELIPEK